MTSDRPHRAALSADAAAAELHRAVAAGQVCRDAVHAVLDAAGHGRAAAPPAPCGLREREIEVLARLARGQTNKQIAAALYLSPRTVQHHVAHIYDTIDRRARGRGDVRARASAARRPAQPEHRRAGLPGTTAVACPGRRGHHGPMRASDTVRALVAVGLVLGGCGDSSPQLAPIERRELHAVVERARSAATARDLSATNAALEALQTRVRALREAGRVDGETAEQLMKYSAIAQLRARRALRAEPATAPAAEADPPPAAEPARGRLGGANDKENDKETTKTKEDKDKDKGNGNGKAGE